MEDQACSIVMDSMTMKKIPLPYTYTAIVCVQRTRSRLYMHVASTYTLAATTGTYTYIHTYKQERALPTRRICTSTASHPTPLQATNVCLVLISLALYLVPASRPNGFSGSCMPPSMGDQSRSTHHQWEAQSPAPTAAVSPLPCRSASQSLPRISRA